jgi:hypothetical protein
VNLVRSIGQEAVQARLVGRIGKLARDATHSLVFGNQEPGHVLGEMNPCRPFGKTSPNWISSSSTTWGNATIAGIAPSYGDAGASAIVPRPDRWGKSAKLQYSLVHRPSNLDGRAGIG